MSGFSSIDLSKLPTPQVVETFTFENILSSMLDDYYTRNPDHTALVESDPAYKLAEAAAYREMLLRQRVNDAARAVMLASAKGSDLENLAALVPTERLLLDAGDPDAIPPVPPTYESDEDFRARTQLAPEGFSVAGPAGAYVFHSLSVPGVKDVYVHSPRPVDVEVFILAHVKEIEPEEGQVVEEGTVLTNKGLPDAELLGTVTDTLMHDDVRPFTDRVTVFPATLKEYSITATLHMLAGPSKDTAKAEAEKRIAEYVASRHTLGGGVPVSGICAALHVAGVDKVTVTEPAVNILCEGFEAAWCTNVTLDVQNA